MAPVSRVPCAAACAYLGDRAGATVLFQLLEPHASQIVFTNGGVLGAVAHYLAVLAATFGDFDEAQSRFAVAAATHERIGAATWLARTRLEWARMLRARAKPRTPSKPTTSCARHSPPPGDWD